MFNKIKTTEATISFSQQVCSFVKKFWVWIMSVSGMSGSVGFLSFFNSQIGVAITCGLIIFITGIGLIILYSIFKNMEQNYFTKDLVNNSDVELCFAFQLVIKSGNQLQLNVLRDKNINILKHTTTPIAKIDNHGSIKDPYIDLILETRLFISDYSVLDIKPYNNKLEPTFEPLHKSNNVLMIRIYVNENLDMNNGQYKVTLEKNES